MELKTPVISLSLLGMGAMVVTCSISRLDEPSTEIFYQGVKLWLKDLRSAILLQRLQGKGILQLYMHVVVVPHAMAALEAHLAIPGKPEAGF